MRSASRESSSCVIAARTARSELNKGYATVIIKIHGQMQALHIWSRDVRASLSGVPRTRYFSATALLSDGRRGVAEAAERGRRSPLLITSNAVNPWMSTPGCQARVRKAGGLGWDDRPHHYSTSCVAGMKASTMSVTARKKPTTLIIMMVRFVVYL